VTGTWNNTWINYTESAPIEIHIYLHFTRFIEVREIRDSYGDENIFEAESTSGTRQWWS
jgi:hypothetical protein